MNVLKAALLSLLLLPAVSLRAVAGWEDDAVSALQQSNTQAARKLAESRRDSKRGKIVLFAAYAKEYDKSGNAKAMAKAKAIYKDLISEVAVDDAVLLHALRKLPGSLLHSYTETLMDQALQRVKTADHARAVPEALETVFKSERYKIFAGLSDWLGRERQQWMQGGTLDEETRSVLLDERLIMVLLDNVEARKLRPHGAAMHASLPPAPRAEPPPVPRFAPRVQLPPRTNATARECLVLIEEPAIPMIKARLPELGDAGVDLLADICTAKSVRESLNPKDGWGRPCTD